MHLDGFGYESAEMIREELRADALTTLKPLIFPGVPETSYQAELTRIGETPIYCVDALVRRALPLQKTQEVMLGAIDCIRIHPVTASKYQLN